MNEACSARQNCLFVISRCVDCMILDLAVDTRQPNLSLHSLSELSRTLHAGIWLLHFGGHFLNQFSQIEFDVWSLGSGTTVIGIGDIQDPILRDKQDVV